MNTSTLRTISIYPSQLNSFKEKAKKLASAIEKAGIVKKVPSQLRYEILAKSLGYKGHSDLKEKTKFRAQADKHDCLIIFSNENMPELITTNYCEKFPDIRTEQDLIRSICKLLANQEDDSWSAGIAKITDDSNIWIKITFTKEGIEFLNITRKFLIALDWKTCTYVAESFGIKNSRAELISFLNGYLEKVLLIEGIHEPNFKDLVIPVVRSLYYAAEDKNRDFLDMHHSKHLKSVFA